MRAVVASLPLILLFAGCVVTYGGMPDPCRPPALTVFAGPSEAEGVARAPGEVIPLLYWSVNTYQVEAEIEASVTSTATGVFPDNHSTHDPYSTVEAQEHLFGGFRVAANDSAGEVVVISTMRPYGMTPPGEMPCFNGPGTTSVTFPLAPPADRDTAAIGKGVLVRTGGFWTDGTSFYTNHAGVDGEPGIPKGYLGPYEGNEPLKVYVYAEGETVPPKRYQDAGFAMTIRGFNAALDGFPVGTARVAYLEPEEAYTAEGREEHPLYGDALVFWIEVDEIVDLPCPLPQPACDLPGVPRVPLPPVPPLP